MSLIVARWDQWYTSPPRPTRSFKGADPRGGSSRNYLEWRFDTKELFRVVVKSWIIYFTTPKIVRVTVCHGQIWQIQVCCQKQGIIDITVNIRFIWLQTVSVTLKRVMLERQRESEVIEIDNDITSLGTIKQSNRTVTDKLIKKPCHKDFVSTWSESVLGKGLTFDFFCDTLVRKNILVTTLFS